MRRDVRQDCETVQILHSPLSKGEMILERQYGFIIQDRSGKYATEIYPSIKLYAVINFYLRNEDAALWQF